jgi:hypothetical protein
VQAKSNLHPWQDFGLSPHLYSYPPNLPKPETSTSSPEADVDLTISRSDSTISTDRFFAKPIYTCTCSTRTFFVNAMSELCFCGGNEWLE